MYVHSQNTSLHKKISFFLTKKKKKQQKQTTKQEKGKDSSGKDQYPTLLCVKGRETKKKIYNKNFKDRQQCNGLR